MKTVTIKIQMLSDWHVSSGQSGAKANLVTAKDKNGFPFLPGKTLKGLLNEAAYTLNHHQPKLISKEFIDTVFGEENIGFPAVTTVNSAFVGRSLQQALLSSGERKKISQLYRIVSSTAMNEKGTAKQHSLRHMEVCMPISLYATISGFPDDQKSEEQLENCLKYVKKLGVNRNRGLGMCQL